MLANRLVTVLGGAAGGSGEGGGQVFVSAMMKHAKLGSVRKIISHREWNMFRILYSYTANEITHSDLGHM